LHTPTRAAQGSLNATAHFQAQVQQALGDYYGQFCVLSVDDLLLWEDNEAHNLERSLLVWRRLHAAGFKGAALKLELYTGLVLWCGRYADEEGVWHDP
jgi:hypothetical protein